MSAPLEQGGGVPQRDPMEPLPLYQPPDPNDLRLFPPQTPACALVRGMLRDFVDHELDAADNARVEDHVHECRVCALALGRAEFEVFRIRSGFLGNWAKVSPRPGFSKRTVKRVLAETATDRRLPSATEARTVEVAVRPRNRAARMRSMVAAAGLGALLCAIAVSVIWPSGADLSSVVRLSIMQVHDTLIETGDGSYMAKAETGLGEGGTLIVKSDGQLEGLLTDRSITGKQPAAAVVVHGGSKLRLQDGLPLLMRGSMEVSSQRGTLVLMGDGSRSVELGAGRYLLTVTEQASAFDSLRNLGPNLALSVEVLSGDGAAVALDAGGHQVIGSGQIGRFGNAFRGIAVENVPPPVVSAPVPPRHEDTPPTPTPDVPQLEGTVVGVNAWPVAGATVDLHYHVEGGLHSAPSLLTDAGGRFRLDRTSGIRNGFVLLEARGPSAMPGWAVQDAYLLQNGQLQAGPFYTLPQVQVTSQALVGTVTDNRGLPLAGATVVPCIYDEVLGLVQPLNLAAGGSQTDAAGLFVLAGLPGRLPARQQLSAFVYDADHEVIFRPLPDSSAGYGPIRFELAPLRTVSLQHLPPGAREVYEEIVDLRGPLSSLGFRWHRLQVPASGEVAGLRVGLGRLWLRSDWSGVPKVRELRREGHEGSEYEPAIDRTLQQDVFRGTFEASQVFAGESGDELRLFPQRRHDLYHPVATPPGASPSNQQTFYVTADGGSQPLVNAQAFALSQRPGGGYSARFLGLENGGGFAMNLDAEESEVVAFDGGAIRWLDGGNVRSSRRVSPQVTGRAQILDELPQDRPVQVTLLPRDQGAAGARPPLFRLVSASDPLLRDLPPGNYDVETDQGHTYVVSITANGLTQIH